MNKLQIVNKCCKWNYAEHEPLPQYSVLLVTDSRNPDGPISVIRTSNDMEEINFEITHWMFLSDLCRPNFRKCQAPIEQVKSYTEIKIQMEQEKIQVEQQKIQNFRFFWSMIFKAFLYLLAFILFYQFIYLLGTKILWTDIIDHSGDSISKAILSFRK